MRTYQKPETDIILISASNVMQGIIEVSGQNGPIVDPDNPIIDPNDPNGGLVNHNKLWDELEDWL